MPALGIDGGLVFIQHITSHIFTKLAKTHLPTPSPTGAPKYLQVMRNKVHCRLHSKETAREAGEAGCWLS